MKKISIGAHFITTDDIAVAEDAPFYLFFLFLYLSVSLSLSLSLCSLQQREKRPMHAFLLTSVVVDLAAKSQEPRGLSLLLLFVNSQIIKK